MARTDRIARLLTAEPPTHTAERPDRDPPSPLSVDLEVWMTGLAHQLARIESSLTPAPGEDPPVTPRGRTARPG